MYIKTNDIYKINRGYCINYNYVYIYRPDRQVRGLLQTLAPLVLGAPGIYRILDQPVTGAGLPIYG